MYTRKNPKSEGVAIIGGAVSRFGRFESFNSRDLVHEAYIETIKSVEKGIDPTEIDRVGVPAIRNAVGNCEVLVIDEVGKFTVESEDFVDAVREALEYDMPTLLTLHKKSRHPLLQDIRRRDDGRILEVTPVNRALLPYKVLKLISESP